MPSKKAKSKPSEAALREQKQFDALKRYKKAPPQIAPEAALYPTVQMRYTSIWSSDVYTSHIVLSNTQVTVEEVVEYVSFCLNKKVQASDITELKRLQFLVRKQEFDYDKTIPEEAKRGQLSLIEWHKRGLSYAPDSDTKTRQSFYELLAQRALDGHGPYTIEFVQILSFDEAPKPVPEAMLKALQKLLQQQMTDQQALLQRLQGFQPPIWVQAGTSKQLLQPQDIALISSEPRQGLAVYTLSGEQHLSFNTLGQLEKQLEGVRYFMRTSRQHFVNLSQIKSIQPAGRGRDLYFLNQPDTLTARVTAAYLPEFLQRMGQT